MKKLISALLALCLVSAMAVTAWAADVNQDSTDKTSQVQISASISPTYIVSIPNDVSVTFNATETNFGSIEVTQAQIEPNKQIRVTLSASGALKNVADNSKTLPYTVTDSAGSNFTSGTYLKDGDKTELTINITQDDWKKAYAGSYSDTVTFTVSYEDKK